jgi:hypothetical protein
LELFAPLQLSPERAPRLTCSPLKVGPSAHHDVGMGRSRSSAIRVAWAQFET